jgi:hypothetical protein
VNGYYSNVVKKMRGLAPSLSLPKQQDFSGKYVMA